MKPYSLDDYVGANQYNSSMMEEPEVLKFGNSFFDDDQMGTTDPAKETQDASNTARVNELYNKLQKVRELQSGVISPEQTWAGGLLAILPGLAGLATGGNEGAAMGFDAGGKIGGGYLGNVVKQNYKAGEDLKELIKQDAQAEYADKRLKEQNDLIRERADYNRLQNKDLLKEKIDEGLVRNPSAGRPEIDLPIEIYEKVQKGLPLSAKEEMLIDQAFGRGAPNWRYSVGQNKKLIEGSAVDKLSVADAALAEIENVKGLVNSFDYAPEGAGFFSRAANSISRVTDRMLDPGSPEAQFSSRVQPIITAVARLRDVGALSNQDRSVVSPLLAGGYKDLAILSKEQLNGIIDYAGQLIANNAEQLRENYKSARRVGVPTSDKGGEFLGVIEDEPGSTIDEVATAKSLAELEGNKVSDETEPRKRLSDFRTDEEYKNYYKSLKKGSK